MTEYNYWNQLAPELQEAETEYQQAEENLLYQVEKIQAECHHPIIAYDEYRRLEYLRSLAPIRMCLRCRLEEHAASLWHDGNKHWSKGVLNPNSDRLYVHTPRDTIYRLRLEGSKIRDYAQYDD
jgi:hypothetical protein